MNDTCNAILRDLSRLIEEVAERHGITVDEAIQQLVTHIKNELESVPHE